MKENRRYLLDTNVLIEIIHGNRTVINHVLAVGTKACAVSLLLSRFEILSLPDTPDDYGRIKTTLRNHGQIVDEFDMVIAGQALFNDMIVVTNNLKHFKGIDNLLVEDWSR